MHTIFEDFRDGLRSYGTAWRIIRERKLWSYMLIPGIVSVVFGVAIAFLAAFLSGEVADFISSKYPWETGASLVRRIARFVSVVTVAAGAFMIYKYVILILVSPFMSPLSEKVENFILGNDETAIPFSISRAMKEMMRGIRISLRNVIRELLMTLLLLLASVIPLVGLLSAPAIFIIQAYFAGFGNMDYTLERHMGVRQSADFVKSCKGMAIANGMIFLLMLMVPVIGLFVAPTLATVAGAIVTVDRIEGGVAIG